MRYSRKQSVSSGRTLRYLKSFNESFANIGYGDINDDRIEDNVKDIFVEYQDSNDLDVVVGKGHLPMTVADLYDDVIEVKLFAQRGIRFNEISGEIGMLIEYMKSLTDKEVKIYYELDRGGLRNWRPLAGSDNEFDYYLQGKGSMSFNTIRMYFVESVGKKVNESSQDDNKIIADIDDMFIELKDHGFTYLCRIQDVRGKREFDMITHGVGSKYFDLNWIEDSVEMVKDYLRDYFDFTEVYRVGYKIEDSDGQYKVGTITYDNFTDCISEVDSDMDSIATKLEDSGWINCLYHLSGIKIIFTEK